MRNNPNKVIKITRKNGEEYAMFITGKNALVLLACVQCEYKGGIRQKHL